MEKENKQLTFEGAMHNRYDVFVYNKEHELKSKATGYNSANSEAYLRVGYIDGIQLVGSPNSEIKIIEPKDTDPNDLTDYWERAIIPQSLNDKFTSCYKTNVYFLNNGTGTIDGIKLYGGSSLISEAYLRDMEGNHIILNYDISDTVVIHAYIYIIVDISNRKKYTNLNNMYPLKWFAAPYSILGGSCGAQKDLLEKRTGRFKTVHVPGGQDYSEEIMDGFLPMPNIKYYAVSKAPIPKEVNGYLEGGINDYQIIEDGTRPEWSEPSTSFKNATLGTVAMKGLIRSFVVPGIGLMDARDITDKSGIFGEGVFQSNVFFPGDSPIGDPKIYIPDEYIKKGILNSHVPFISIKKNAFYGSNVEVKVRRYEETTVINGESIPLPMIEDPNNGKPSSEVPLNEPFFTNKRTTSIVQDEDDRLYGSSDKKECRSWCFSQHVPLTEDYCGAESVIPCLPSGGKDISLHCYGYYIVYQSKDVQNLYLKANYAVSGQIVTEDYLGKREKITFPYILEYSYNGDDFTVAARFEANSRPYTPQFFGTIAAPIWRIRGGVNAYSVIRTKYTTHSDPHVAYAAGTKNNGYDPLFIFVGFDSTKSGANNVTLPQGHDGVAISNPQSLCYEKLGWNEWLGDYEPNVMTAAPYSCQPNSTYFFCGTIEPYSQEKEKKE